MAMIIIMSGNKDDKDDLIKVLCAHTFLMMMYCTLSWFHKTPFIKLHIAQILHTVHGTQGSNLHNVQRLQIAKNFTHHMGAMHTADNCTVCMALRLHTVAQHWEQESWPKKYFHTIHLISISLQADAQSLPVITILTLLLFPNNDITSYSEELNSETSTIHKSMLCLEVSVQSDSHLWMDLFQVWRPVVMISLLLCSTHSFY